MQIDFKGTLEGTEKAQAALRYITEVLVSDDAQRVLVAVGRDVRDAARANAPSRTGTLRRSIVSLSVRASTRAKYGPGVIIKTTQTEKDKGRGAYAPHGHLVEYGSKERRARNRSTMVIQDAGGSKWVRAKRVAPMPARHFFARAVQSVAVPGLDKAAGEIERLIVRPR